MRETQGNSKTSSVLHVLAPTLMVSTGTIGTTGSAGTTDVFKAHPTKFLLLVFPQLFIFPIIIDPHPDPVQEVTRQE